MDPEFNVWKEKQLKFDKLANEFPSNLVTPVDAAYLKQALRRFRQNKAKRDKTKAAAKMKDPKELRKETEEEKKMASPEEEKPVVKTRTVRIPGMGVEFQTKVWAEEDFE
jgi:sRNA-binding protein